MAPSSSGDGIRLNPLIANTALSLYFRLSWGHRLLSLLGSDRGTGFSIRGLVCCCCCCCCCFFFFLLSPSSFRSFCLLALSLCSGLSLQVSNVPFRHARRNTGEKEKSRLLNTSDLGLEPIFSCPLRNKPRSHVRRREFAVLPLLMGLSALQSWMWLLETREHILQLLSKRSPGEVRHIVQGTNTKDENEDSHADNRQPSGPARLRRSKEPDKNT